MERSKPDLLCLYPVVDSIGVILDKVRGHTPSKATSLAVSLIKLISEEIHSDADCMHQYLP
jgi:hypothetical protein